MLIVLKFQIKLMNILGWGLDFNYCSICQKQIEGDNHFSYSLGGFLCACCAKNADSATLRVHEKISKFLEEISKIDFSEKSKYDELVNYMVLEKCFLFMKKYIDNLTNKKTKIFEVLEKVSLV